MGDFAVSDAQRSAFQTSSAVTPSATANTYGSWAQQVASLAYDVSLWDLHVYMNSNAGIDGLIDIGIGAAASEVAILTLPTNQQQATESFFTVPLWLPAGARISARAKLNTTTAAQFFPDFHLFAAPNMADYPPRQRAITYGITNSSGTSVSTGATSGYGAWTQITASSTNQTKLMLLCLQPSTGSGSADILTQIDIGIGAAGSEVAVFSQLYTYYMNARNPMPNSIGPLPCSIPAGTRLAVRAKAPNNSGTFTVKAALVGID